jgi:hypothetical protein
MFRTAKFLTWLERIDEALDDVLGDPLIAEPPHPHRIPLRWSYERRRGSLPPRPAHCLSPVRGGGGARQPDHAAR